MNLSRTQKEPWKPNLSKPLVEVQAEIGQALQRFIQQDALQGWRGAAQLLPAVAHALAAPGKRVRPCLVILSAHAGVECPHAEGDTLLAIATAVEMIHTYSLIHDDLPCMDDDVTRRGVPACHVAFGVRDATWAGMALIPEAFLLLARGFSASGGMPDAARVLGAAAGFTGMVGGQWLDTQLPGTAVSSDEFIGVHRRKTGALLAGCCVLGGMAGNADEATIDALRVFGESLGLAFQATDDLLDVRGDKALVGKGVGKDAHAGKLTAPAALGVEGAQRYAEGHIRTAVAATTTLHGPAAQRLRDLALSLGTRVR